MASEQKERILRFYRGSEGEETAVRLLDLAETVVKTRKFRISPFLDPYGQEIAETIRASYDDLQLDFDGGYQAVIAYDPEIACDAAPSGLCGADGGFRYRLRRGSVERAVCTAHAS